MAPPPSEINRFVGKNKSKADLNVRSGLTKPKSEAKKDDVVQHVKEYYEWTNPSFNVLVVETPRPSFLDSPALKAFAVTLQETRELLKSLARFGLPETSVRNKCPHWRSDQSTLQTSASIPLQRALHVLTTNPPATHKHHFGHASSQSHTGMSMNLGMHPNLGPKHGQAQVESASGQKFLFNEDTALLFTTALNLAVWWLIWSPPKARVFK